MHTLARASLGLSSLLFAASALAWSPDLNDPGWMRSLFAHRCADVRINNTTFRVHCAADGSVAALQGPVDTWAARASSATLLWQTRLDPALGSRSRSTTVSALGDVVIVERVTCPMCARVGGQLFAIRPSNAPEPVLRAAQSIAGVPGAPLRTVSAWRSARP